MTNYIYAPWTPEQEAQAIRWRKLGMTYAEVAQQMHVSKTTAEKRLKDICARAIPAFLTRTHPPAPV